MHRTYAELDEYLEKALKEAGYAGVDVQKNPVGSRITVFVTRPGLAIGRRGTGIKDLTERVAAKFTLPNPQIAVSEVEIARAEPADNGGEDGPDSRAGDGLQEGGELDHELDNGSRGGWRRDRRGREAAKR